MHLQNQKIMNNLPKGNYALAIAHPGHEMRLYGLLETVKPFTFILTDGSEKTGNDLMGYSIRTIDRAITRDIKLNHIQRGMGDKFKRIFNITIGEHDKRQHLKDSWIYYYVQNLQTGLLASFTDMMVKNMIKYKVDNLICDASEDYHLSHEVVRMLSELAILKVQSITGKEIKLFEYSVNKNYIPSPPQAVHLLELNEEQLDRKLNALIDYPNAVDELRPFISCDMNVIMQIGKMPDGRERIKILLKKLNLDFLQNEFIYPAREIEPTDNYKKFIEPLYGMMLEQEMKKAS